MHATMTDHVSCAIVPYDHSGQPYFQQSYVPYGAAGVHVVTCLSCASGTIVYSVHQTDVA